MKDDPAILVVEDDKTVCAFLHLLLDALGFTNVTMTWMAEYAAELAMARRFDLIISDHYLPNMTGVELHRKLRTAGCQTPFLLISGADDSDFMQNITASGIRYFLPKPFDLDTFRHSVNLALETAVLASTV